MVRVSGVPYEVDLLSGDILDRIYEHILVEREECAKIAEIPNMAPADIARAIRARSQLD